jgi:pre-mRNA-splicing factor SYF1
MLDLKIITPIILINFTNFLEKEHYYEESFKVFEAGI